MKIQMTQEDIANGECGDPYRCPIALAIVRQLGRKACVDTEVIVIVNPTGEPDRFKTSKRVANFVRRFDNLDVVQPITFRL